MAILTDSLALKRALAARIVPAVTIEGFSSGIDSFDELAPGGSFARSAVHELLSPGGGGLPKSIALQLALGTMKRRGEGPSEQTEPDLPSARTRRKGRAPAPITCAMAWSDPEGEVYPPAFGAAGVDLRQLLLLRSTSREEQLWAIAECLRCRAICATVANLQKLNQIEARRLQLAAERGGGVGLFMRPYAPGAKRSYAAATRWLVQPAPCGVDGAQRWQVELLHGHGGQTGKVLLLEMHRETRSLCASAPLADRSAASAAALAAAKAIA